MLEHFKLRGFIHAHCNVEEWISSHTWMNQLDNTDVEDPLIELCDEYPHLHQYLKSSYRLSELNDYSLIFVGKLKKDLHIIIDRKPSAQEMNTLLHHNHTWEYALQPSDIPFMFQALKDNQPWFEYLIGLLSKMITTPSEEELFYRYLIQLNDNVYIVNDNVYIVPPCQFEENMSLFLTLMLKHELYYDYLIKPHLVQSFLHHLDDGLSLSGTQFYNIFSMIIENGWFAHLHNIDFIENAHFAAHVLEIQDADIFAWHCQAQLGYLLTPPSYTLLDLDTQWTHSDPLSMLLQQHPQYAP